MATFTAVGVCADVLAVWPGKKTVISMVSPDLGSKRLLIVFYGRPAETAGMHLLPGARMRVTGEQQLFVWPPNYGQSGMAIVVDESGWLELLKGAPERTIPLDDSLLEVTNRQCMNHLSESAVGTGRDHRCWSLDKNEPLGQFSYYQGNRIEAWQRVQRELDDIALAWGWSKTDAGWLCPFCNAHYHETTKSAALE